MRELGGRRHGASGGKATQHMQKLVAVQKAKQQMDFLKGASYVLMKDYFP
jgi:hypothetical protein